MPVAPAWPTGAGRGIPGCKPRRTEKHMSDLHIIAYVGLVAVYRLAENVVMARTGSIRNRPRREWSMALIVVPYVLVIAVPLLEAYLFEVEPGTVSLVLGALLFLAATAVRVKGHLDLGRGFSMAVQEVGDAALVRSGLYAHIRHPLYLGNALLFAACPTFLASRLAWACAVLGWVGIVLRIRVEERFLVEHMAGYAEYVGETSALLPGLF